jgi:hypothetical protein
VKLAPVLVRNPCTQLALEGMFTPYSLYTTAPARPPAGCSAVP